LVAVHPAYDLMFDTFAPEHLHGKPKARTEWAVQTLKTLAKASQNLGLQAHATFSGSLIWHTVYPWPQRPQGLVEAGFKELANRWLPILNAFDNAGVDLCYEIHPNEDVVGNYTDEAARYRLNETDATPSAIEAAQRMYGYYLSLTQRMRVVDKYPELVFRIPFVRALFPEAKFVFIARNGWDTCSSIDEWSQRFRAQENGEVHDWWGRDQRKWRIMLEELILTDASLSPLHDTAIESCDDRLMAVIEWIVTMREGMCVAHKYPESVLTVRYEDLVASPRNKLGEIAQFCEMESDERFLTYGERVLKTGRSRASFKLPSTVSKLFLETMNQLGYV